MNTNDYMNNIIKNARLKKYKNHNLEDIIFRKKDGRIIPIKIDYAYHYGDLGKGHDTYFGQMNASYRSTGHFGTGTYFLSKEGAERIKDYFNDRPLRKVNFNEYKNLFKPKDAQDAFLLHRGLRNINYFEDNFNNIFHTEMTSMLKKYGLKDEDISRAFYKTKQTYYSKTYQQEKNDVSSKLDSLSTVFMKELGYNGVDVRKIKSYDDEGAGSVIYDLNKKK